MALNPAFDYSGRNFSNIKRDLLRRANVVAPTWTDRDPSDFGMMLVDLWSYMGDIIHYYIDRASQEAFIQTATQRESVLAFANLYDYQPNFRTSALMTAYIHNTGSASTTLPAGTKIKVLYNDSYYHFHTPVSYPLPASKTTNVLLYEGKRIENDILTASASGLSLQTYRIRSKTVVPTSIRVFVYPDGVREEWLRYDSISDIPYGSPGFVVNVTPESEIEIIFGDRANGLIPPSGTLIQTSYTESTGTSGNLPGNLQAFFEEANTADLRIDGVSSATGGSTGDDVESIRSALQKIIRTQDRAVTLQDYADLAQTVNGVYDAMAFYYPSSASASGGGSISYIPSPWSAYGTGASVSYTPGNASASGGGSITVLPVPLITDFLGTEEYTVPLASELTSAIVKLLDSKKMVGITTRVQNKLYLTAVNITLSIQVNEKFVSNWVINDVTNALDDLFKFTKLKFGRTITPGEIYKAVLSIDGVDSATITTLQYEKEAQPATNTTSRVTVTADYTQGSSFIKPTDLLRKGVFTINASGGINTSV